MFYFWAGECIVNQGIENNNVICISDTVYGTKQHRRHTYLVPTVRKQLVALLARQITVIPFTITQIGIHCPRIRIVSSSLYS